VCGSNGASVVFCVCVGRLVRDDDEPIHDGSNLSALTKTPDDDEKPIFPSSVTVQIRTLVFGDGLLVVEANIWTGLRYSAKNFQAEDSPPTGRMRKVEEC